MVPEKDAIPAGPLGLPREVGEKPRVGELIEDRKEETRPHGRQFALAADVRAEPLAIAHLEQAAEVSLADDVDERLIVFGDVLAARRVRSKDGLSVARSPTLADVLLAIRLCPPGR